MVSFMDDLMIHAETKERHDQIVLEALHHLRENCLCIAPDKCEWARPQVEFLGYMVSGEGVQMMDDKIASIQDIKPASSQKEVQHFFGFANFYRRFIKDYSRICLPLTLQA